MSHTSATGVCPLAANEPPSRSISSPGEDEAGQNRAFEECGCTDHQENQRGR